jgi:hypothetical protein
MLTSFGVASVSLMLFAYALEDRAPNFVLVIRGCVRRLLSLRIPGRRMAIRYRRGGVDHHQHWMNRMAEYFCATLHMVPRLSS